MPRTVFAASATAFSAAFAKLSLDVPTTSITFCVICGFPLILISPSGLYSWSATVSAPASGSLPTHRRCGCQAYGIPLGMYSEGFGLKPSDRSVRAAVFVREEPDEDEEEQ